MTQLNYQRPSDSGPPPHPRGTQVIALIISWAIVGVPAAWGVAQTVRKSIPLFTRPTAHNVATRPSA